MAKEASMRMAKSRFLILIQFFESLPLSLRTPLQLVKASLQSIYGESDRLSVLYCV